MFWEFMDWGVRRWGLIPFGAVVVTVAAWMPVVVVEVVERIARRRRSR